MRQLAAMAARGDVIVGGPWLGEVGFELLYWVPFLRWFAARFRVPPERLLVLSRGGTHHWYTPFAGRYADVFDQVTPEAFRAEHDARVHAIGEQKQTQVTEFERWLIAAATGAGKIGGWSVLHPSRMYDVLNPFWWGHFDAAWVTRHVTYARLQAPDVPGLTRPNAPYTAVKFYFNECFPATPANRAFVRDVVQSLLQDGPVVALSSGLNIDDHSGARLEAPGVHHLPEGLPAAQNLLVQSALVAGAQSFVGTYGGFSYLAPFYGVPTRAYYSDASGFSPKHLLMAREAFAAIGTAGLFDVSDIADAAAADARRPVAG